MKRRFAVVMLVVLLAVGAAWAGEMMQDVKANPSCKYCGMDREKFAHSRMLIEYEGGKASATCSLHCAALDLAVSMDSMPSDIRVADYNTKELISAEDAVWVMGGKAPGVMTMRAKWAFKDEASAKAFVAANGGEIVPFDEAVSAAYEDMDKDTMMIRSKRAMKGHDHMKHMDHMEMMHQEMQHKH